MKPLSKTITVQSDQPVVVVPLEEYERLQRAARRIPDTAKLSEPSLQDWNRQEEDRAWHRLQPAR